MGGLGNQMFQYAFARAKSLRLRRGFCLDKSFLNVKKNKGEYTIRNFELDCFNLQYKTAGLVSVYLYRFLDIIFRKLNLNQKIIEYEKTIKFDKDLVNSNASVFIGYFQSEKYFQEYREQIIKDFQLKDTISKYSQDVLCDIEGNYENSVSVHLRRGDYVSLQSASDVHGTCSVDYYKKAIETIRGFKPAARFYFFSDDMNWVKKEFFNIDNSFFVEDSPDKKSFEDMYIMSRCHSNIIANSSYSWWGAWLNQNTEKVVIAPKEWFSKKEFCSEDIIPSEWMKI